MNKDYEGFSKQDLLDRYTAIESERADLFNQLFELKEEMIHINKLLEEMK
jgi:hypothetical protein